jgi:hypothetical protein
MSRFSKFFSGLGKPDEARNSAARPFARTAQALPEPFGPHPGADDFKRLQVAYLDSGGLMRLDDVARLVAYRGTGTLHSLNAQVAAHQMMAFRFIGRQWFPLFQLDFTTFTPRPELQPVLSELVGIMDDWAMAAWFVEANQFLEGRRLVDLIAHHQPAVVSAALGDRLIATGGEPVKRAARQA